MYYIFSGICTQVSVNWEYNMDAMYEGESRRRGRKMSPAERAKKKFVELINMQAQFTRIDVGGTDHAGALRKKAVAWAKEKGINFSDNGYNLLAEFALREINHQLNGCRNRSADNLTEMKTRIGVLESALGMCKIDDIASCTKLLNRAINGASDNDVKEEF